MKRRMLVLLVTQGDRGEGRGEDLQVTKGDEKVYYLEPVSP